MFEGMFSGGWTPIVRIFIVGVLGYVTLIVILRISGKRALAKMNAFDMVVTVALGSILAGAFVNEEVALLTVVTIFAVLLGLQYVVSFGTQRLKWFEKLVKADPTLLVIRGEMVDKAMDKERIPEAEVLQAARSAGFPNLGDVAAMILETDGSFSVIGSSGAENIPTLTNVKRF